MSYLNDSKYIKNFEYGIITVVIGFIGVLILFLGLYIINSFIIMMIGAMIIILAIIFGFIIFFMHSIYLQNG